MSRKKEKILTVSIAAYNVEKYLEQTLTALNDSRILDDLEVLIVDDGSKDGTREIALKYQNLAPDTFRCIQKENGGHGSTINKGIELAAGRYFRVIDGDDWVETEGFVQYVRLLRQTDADLVLTQFKTNCGGKETVEVFVHNMDRGKIYSWDDPVDIRLFSMHMLTIRTSLLREHQVRITEQCFYVDIEYVIWNIYLAKTMTYFDIPVYVYRIGHSEQSVNIRNMTKNVGMQEKVSYRLAELYQQFTASGEMEEKKRQALLQRISVSLSSTIRAYLMLPDAEESKEKVIAFEKGIKSISEELYEYLSYRTVIKLLRHRNYALVPLLRMLYRIKFMLPG